MWHALEQMFGIPDDIRCNIKMGISRALTIYVLYVLGHFAIAWFFLEWMFVGHTLWTLAGVYGLWWTVWVKLNRYTDAGILLAVAGSHGIRVPHRAIDMASVGQWFVEMVRRIFVVIIVTGLGFYYIPTYYSFSLTLGICLAFILYALSGLEWSWTRWYKVSVAAMLLQLAGLLLKVVNFGSFFNDSRNDMSSYPWMWIIFLVLIVAVASWLQNKIPAEKKESHNAHGH